MESLIDGDLEVAMRYLNQVKRTVGIKKYKRFFKLTEEYRDGSTNLPEWISSVNQLLNGHHELLQGFTFFLPGNNPTMSVKVKPSAAADPKEFINGGDYDVGSPKRHQLGFVGSFDDEGCLRGEQNLLIDDDSKVALCYFKKLKETLGGDSDKCRSFYTLIRDYGDEKLSVPDLISAIKELLSGHHDLVQGFTFFLPNSTFVNGGDEFDLGCRKRRKFSHHVPEEDTASFYFNESDVGSCKRHKICGQVAMEDTTTVNADDKFPVGCQKRKKKSRDKSKSKSKSKRHKQGERMIQQATDFVNRVREGLISDGEGGVFTTFLDSVCEYNKEGKTSSIHEFEKKMELLFKDHPDVLRELSVYTKDLYVAADKKSSSSQRKSVNEYKAMMFKCEDDHFEVDLAYHRFVSVTEKIKLLVEDAEEGVQIPDLNEYFTPIHLRCFELLYGADDKKIMIDQLRKSPINAGIRVLIRLNQKLDQLKDYRRVAEKNWVNVNKLYHDMLQKRK